MNDENHGHLKTFRLFLTITLVSVFLVGLHVLDARTGPNEFNFSITYWSGDANPLFTFLGQIGIAGAVIGSFLTGSIIEDLAGRAESTWKKLLFVFSGLLAMAGGFGLVFTMTCAPKWFTMLVLLSCFIGVLATQFIRPAAGKHVVGEHEPTT